MQMLQDQASCSTTYICIAYIQNTGRKSLLNRGSRLNWSSNVQSKQVALYTCATTRAVYLDLLLDMTAEEFRTSLGEFIVRRGNPDRIVSDNGKTFITTARWLNKLTHNQLVNDYLSKMKIQWQFNLSRSPWWDEFFEHMIELMKVSLRKALGNANLTFKQLKEVLLNVEVTLNNRPLGYLEDDIELPPLTTNSMLHGINVYQPEEDLENLDEETNMGRRARYIKRCKDVMWKRWSSEYVKSLREKHRLLAGKAVGAPNELFCKIAVLQWVFCWEK